MKHTAIAQASPDIAQGGIFHPMPSRIFERRGEIRDLEVSACPLDGRILSTGGEYGTCQFKFIFYAKIRKKSVRLYVVEK